MILHCKAPWSPSCTLYIHSHAYQLSHKTAIRCKRRGWQVSYKRMTDWCTNDCTMYENLVTPFPDDPPWQDAVGWHQELKRKYLKGICRKKTHNIGISKQCILTLWRRIHTKANVQPLLNSAWYLIAKVIREPNTYDATQRWTTRACCWYRAIRW